MSWKQTIWRVPLISLVAGWVWTPLVVRLLVRFAIVRLEDGSVSIDPTRQLLIYGVVMVSVLLIGGLLLLRKLTRKVIFVSASLVVGYSLLLTLAQLVSGITTGPGAVIFLNLYKPLDWMHFPGMLLRELFPREEFTSPYIYLTSILNHCVPYLFVLFGRRSSSVKESSAEFSE